MKSFLQRVLSDIDVEYSDIRIEETEISTIAYRGRELDECRKNFERGGILRLFKKGNWTTASFNTVDDGLKEIAQKKARELELLPPKEETLFLFPPLEWMSLATQEKDCRKIPLTEKIDLVRKYNEILLSGDSIVSTLTNYTERYKTTYFYSTENRYIEQRQVYLRILLSAIARDGSNIQDYAKSFYSREGIEALKGKEEEAEKIAKMAHNLLKAEKVDAGIYTVIIDPKLAGIFAHEAFGHLSEADLLYTNERLRELMKIGTTYGVEELSIVDDPTLSGEWGSYQFDDEGTPAQKTYLIKEGKIASHLHSKETAKRMGEEPTGNARSIDYRFPPICRMSNTFIEPRNKSLEAMLEDIDKGLYVAGARGGMTELEFFTFSSQFAYKIEKGEMTNLVRDVVIQGNVFETLRNIKAIGNDFEIASGGCGKGAQYPLPTGTGGPHIQIKNCLIGGK